MDSVSSARALLDESAAASVAFVVDGKAEVSPARIARVADTLYLRGFTAGRPLPGSRHDDLRICVSVTDLDGSRPDYRSVIVRGTARLVDDPAERARVLATLTDDGGSAGGEVLALPLVEVSFEGVGNPRTARSPWSTATPLRGEHVILEPLDLAHVPDLLAATAHDEVWQHLHLRRPADAAEMTAIVADALRDHRTGARVPWVQRDARSGAVAGTTSYYDISEGRASVAIGHTIIGRPWWRTGLNTEAKLLLLSRAFDELAAERVEWHVDTENTRSHRAVERVGATREGVLRHHHRRQSDGSLRDMVVYSMTADEWPALRARLTSALRPPLPQG
ncbi:bifunctional pyridoxamine 5'-phosphate oxidase family protein/GNAT family N-acetyltransferase [Umezawaea endophytica]|uniref:bifunctional pyridoxamine 5'-phosphate oxidase family protein/GNAT family N-acetyltransferase n=1 Tax=Umezawaea endophytica TaxID=1654476 RepID=UPI0027E32F97|nr:bifunctional pyridoxamine 5'-phosphate oxidase family protein/GNAT family N-acetyltransferase [Umezawaea endophytica]